jgi:hypothetical protein
VKLLANLVKPNLTASLFEGMALMIALKFTSHADQFIYLPISIFYFWWVKSGKHKALDTN